MSVGMLVEQHCVVIIVLGGRKQIRVQIRVEFVELVLVLLSGEE